MENFFVSVVFTVFFAVDLFLFPNCWGFTVVFTVLLVSPGFSVCCLAVVCADKVALSGFLCSSIHLRFSRNKNYTIN